MCLCTICVFGITAQQYVLIYNMYLTSLCSNMHLYTIYVFDIGLFREDLHLTENAICIVVGGTKRTARKEG